MCSYGVNQHLIGLKLDSVSINKPHFPRNTSYIPRWNDVETTDCSVCRVVTVKVSQNTNFCKLCQYSKINKLVGACFQKQSNVWNKTFENKLIAKDHRKPNKWTGYKIFKLKYGNIELPNVLKYKLAWNYIKQVRCS